MANDLNWLQPIITKSFYEGLQAGFKTIWIVLKAIPWQIQLLIALGIILDHSSPKRKRKYGVRY